MIRWGTDLGVPALVAAADIATDELKPTWNRPVGIALAAAGYLLHGLAGIGGDFTKNLGIAAAPWAFSSIYQYVKESTGVGRAVGRPVASRLSGSRISRYPAKPMETPFEGVRLD